MASGQPSHDFWATSSEHLVAILSALDDFSKPVDGLRFSFADVWATAGQRLGDLMALFGSLLVGLWQLLILLLVSSAECFTDVCSPLRLREPQLKGPRMRFVRRYPRQGQANIQPTATTCMCATANLHKQNKASPIASVKGS